MAERRRGREWSTVACAISRQRLSAWFRARVGAVKGRIRRIAIVALARKLLVALWR
jgi:hypothetical protein